MKDDGEVCTAAFGESHILLHHVVSCHIGHDAYADIDELINDLSTKIIVHGDHLGTFKCPLCLIQLPSEIAFKKHMKDEELRPLVRPPPSTKRQIDAEKVKAILPLVANNDRCKKIEERLFCASN